MTKERIYLEKLNLVATTSRNRRYPYQSPEDLKSLDIDLSAIIPSKKKYEQIRLIRFYYLDGNFHEPIPKSEFRDNEAYVCPIANFFERFSMSPNTKFISNLDLVMQSFDENYRWHMLNNLMSKEKLSDGRNIIDVSRNWWKTYHGSSSLTAYRTLKRNELALAREHLLKLSSITPSEKAEVKRLVNLLTKYGYVIERSRQAEEEDKDE